MLHRDDAHLVEVLENGDVMFEGRLVSSSEFIVGTVLCELKKGTDDIDEDSEKDKLSPQSTPPRVDSPNLDEAPMVAPKRRKKRFTSVNLPPDDIRLSYVKRFYDAINTADAAIVRQMLSDITIPKVVMLSRKLTPDPNFYLPIHLEIVGAEAIAATMEQYFIASPDVVCKVSRQRIHVYANDESMIECTTTSKFTKLFDLDGIPEGSDNKVVLSSVVDELGDKLKNVKLSSQEINSVGKVVDIPVAIGAARTSKEIIVEATVSFHLNSMKKIFLIIVTYA